MKLLFQLLILPLPWFIRRRLMNFFLNFDIHPSARIKFSVILADKLVMRKDSRIHHLVMCKRIDLLQLDEDSGIASATFITGFNSKTKHFSHLKKRRCELILGKSAGITSRHFIDCNGGVYIGDYTTVAGLRSQILTHSIDVYKGRQDAQSVHIGKYCFIGTSCIILPGAKVPDYSVVGAGSVVNKCFEKPYMLYAGNPAKPIKELAPEETVYFHRKKHLVK